MCKDQLTSCQSKVPAKGGAAHFEPDISIQQPTPTQLALCMTKRCDGKTRKRVHDAHVCHTMQHSAWLPCGNTCHSVKASWAPQSLYHSNANPQRPAGWQASNSLIAVNWRAEAGAVKCHQQLPAVTICPRHASCLPVPHTNNKTGSTPQPGSRLC